jgi:hypothetical protein
MVSTLERSVTIKSAKDATRLTLTRTSGEEFTAALQSAHFSGRVVASTYFSGPPSLLFDDVAANWRGWKGEKEWAALEDNLRLTATSDSLGHITLTVAMRGYSDPADWRLTGGLELLAGELEALARSVRDVFHDQTI